MEKETLIDLILFMQDKEVHFYEDMTLLFLKFFQIDEFTGIFGDSYFDEDGIDITLKYDYVVIDLNQCWFIEEEDLKIIKEKVKEEI